jgi:hypothetical protein
MKIIGGLCLAGRTLDYYDALLILIDVPYLNTCIQQN